MKTSRYNIFFDYEGQKIGFNSYRREYIALDPMLHEMYEASARRADFLELSEVHPEFYNFLVEKGFLVEPDMDELEQVKKLVNMIDNDESRFELHINPTMNCNFKCWYCYETHIKDSRMDGHTRENVIRFVNAILEERPSIRDFSMSWFGGEPLLYHKKVIMPLLEQAYEICRGKGITFSSAMTTNALLINQEVIDHAKRFNLSFFQITLDGHRERHDKVRFVSKEKGSYDAIVSNIKLLIKNQLRVLVRINCSPETIAGLEDIVNDFADLTEFERNFISFDIHKVWQEHDVIDNEALSDARWLYREKGFVVSTAAYDTVLNSCYGDHRNHATINYNGEVFKCTARDFTTKNSEGLLGGDGQIQWNPKYEKRLNSKFKNRPCLECPIMPICNGGCSQQAIEHEGIDYCVHDFDENKKKQVVIDRFLESLLEA
ncbi:radical SAM protein [Chitinophaga agrisoli]|uniref:Radical SAM protein n=1 Tax=Chitinophaga agrisoli TaxID=2607653 RepID=A0A5B2VHL2_9BACT|nr:radical SAM protein [Chitinophaga agrisoli]KAA2238621.1 radical SAM protein [Chitinophaga agrisoli]